MSVQRHGDRIKRLYERHFLRHDPGSPEAAHWVGKDKTWLRFRVLTQIDRLDGLRVLDFGCGNALLLDFLRDQGTDCQYHGWDISQTIVETAKKRYPESTFAVVDVMKNDLSKYAGFFDYVLVSGVFYIKNGAPLQVHKTWMKAVLRRLWPLCSRGLGVNFMTQFVDWRDRELYYATMSEVAGLCNDELSRHFVIRHDYELWEFTVYIYKAPRERL